LITDAVAEGRELDYKRDAVGDDREARREFLRDVSSFANTAGGHLVIGMDERGGVASALVGITVRPFDDEKLRLENLIRDGIEPRLVGVRIKEVPLAAGGYVLILRIPASWNPPHRVSFGGHNRFYARNSAGAYELSVEQLRSAFLGGVETERRLTEFRVTRLARMDTGLHGGARVANPGRLVVHIVPLTPQPGGIDPRAVEEQPGPFAPPGSTSLNWRYNFDGLLLTAGADDGGVVSAYTQVFRDGRLEAARGPLVRERSGPGPAHALVYGTMCRALIEGVERYGKGLTALGVQPPLAVMVSLLGARGSSMGVGPMSFEEARPLDRDDLLFEPVMIESTAFDEGWQTVLRPTLDALWNAFGRVRCRELFDESGAWKGIPRDW
jgi:hypothetical protein